MNRAYSLLEIKAQDEAQRIITGIATTPTPDRVGDVVEPKGVKFKNPLPLLLFHDSSKPVGTVRFDKATDDGITFTAKLPKIEEPGTLRDRVEEAWQSVKHGLIKGVSIGFRVLDDGIELLRSGGVRFTATEVLELSLVPIPANAEAVIETIKAIDAPHLAATGMGQGMKHVGRPGGTGAVVRLAQKDAPTTMKNLTEQIKEFEASRQAKDAERTGLMNAAAERGETLDAEGEQKYDALTVEIRSIDAHLVRLRDLEQSNKAAAVSVAGANPQQAAASRGPATHSAVQVKSRMPEGLEFAAAVICKVNAFVEIQKGNFVSAMDIAKQRYPDYLGIQKFLQAPVQKTAVAGGTTSDSNWATALLEPNQVLVSDFLEYLRPRTLVGRLPLRRVPFNVTIQSQSTGASASWVGQGKPKPVTKFNSTTTSLAFTKIAAIAVITDELARFSRPGAETLVRDELAKAVIERMDLDFVDPDKAVSSGVNPASITNGVTPLNTAGTSAANALTDIQNLVVPFVENKYGIGGLYILMPESLALALSLMLTTNGVRSFPDLNISGGSIAGLPVVTSQYLANLASYGNMVVCVSTDNVAIADDGSVSVDVSREASIQMDDAPTQDATAGTGASLVSMFQTNSVAIRAEREVNWKKLRSTAVTFMDDVNWGSVGSPR